MYEALTTKTLKFKRLFFLCVDALSLLFLFSFSFLNKAPTHLDLLVVFVTEYSDTPEALVKTNSEQNLRCTFLK